MHLSEERDERGNYVRRVGSTAEHRTVGGRSWCFDCGEWCYPSLACGEPKCCTDVELGPVPTTMKDIAALDDAGRAAHSPVLVPRLLAALEVALVDTAAADCDRDGDVSFYDLALDVLAGTAGG